jgi:dihydropyrimidine dehydrogenase (NAD+) subunit PreT
MSRIPETRTETVFEDYKIPYTKDQALAEANRCLFCEDAQCITACPTAIDIPQFIRKITTENIRGSAKTIFESNILGMSCSRVCPVEVLCVGSCVYVDKGIPPIQIGKLQRYSTDAAYDADWRFFEAGPETGKNVAMVGAGPASLAAAHELRRFGHRVTIFEKRDVIGGLNVTGVAPYKMMSDRGEDEVNWLLSIGGIDIKTGVEVGKDVQVSDLESEYDAVFLGMGLGPDRLFDLPGHDLTGIVGAVDWIEQMKLTQLDTSSIRKVAILGGGNTGMDAVRETLGLGFDDVTLVYRGVEVGMSGYVHEWAAAKSKMARAAWRAQPVSFEGIDGHVTGVVCDVLDENKKPIAGQQVTVPADLVLVAIGQSKLGALFADIDGIDVDWGRIVTDEDGCTGRPGWFAGGDATNGGKEVVNAAAEGKRAAHAIHVYMGA